MAIKTGRYGTVKWNPLGVVSPPGLLAIASINGWKLSLKQDFEDVTCFGDTNKVYVPGMRDISGSLTGFWNSSDPSIVQATDAATPGWLELSPNSQDTVGSPAAAVTFAGLAYLDADLDCTVSGAPKLSASFRAAGAWTIDVS